MKSRHRRSFKLFLALSFVATLFLFYLKIGLFPGQLRDEAILKIRTLTHQNIRFDKAVLLPFSGLNLHDFCWYKENGEVLFKAERVAVHVKWVPFFREKKIIIDHFVLHGPVYDFAMQQPQRPEPEPLKTRISGQINVPVIPQNDPPKIQNIIEGPDIFLPENVYLEQIEIIDGLLTVRPAPHEPIAETIRIDHIRMGFQRPPILSFDGHVTIGSQTYASMQLTGRWDLKKGVYNFLFKTDSDKVPDWLLAYQKDHFLVLRKGALRLETQVWNGGDSQILFRTHADLRNASLTVAASTYSGHMNVDAEGAFDTFTHRFPNYAGDLKLDSVHIANLSEKIRSLENISGELHFEPDLLTIRSIRGEYKKIAFEADGLVRSFKELNVNGDIRSNLSFEQVRSMIPQEYLRSIQDLKIEGRCQTLTHVSGSLKKGAKVETAHKLRLLEGTLSDPRRNLALRQVSGDFSVGPLGVRIDNLQFIYAKHLVEIDAVIPKNTTQPGEIRAKSDQMSFDSRFLWTGQTMRLQQATFRMSGLTLHFRGDLDNWTDPHLEAEGQANLILEQVLAPYKRTLPALKNLRLAGDLKGPFTLKGRAMDLLSSEVQLDAQSKNILIQDKFSMQDVQLQVRLSGKILKIPFFHAQVYGGPFGSLWTFDLSRNPTPFSGNYYMNQVDLKKMARDLWPYQKKLAGILSLKCDLQGLAQTRSSWTGQGAVSVTEGLLFQSDKFKDMGNLPLVRVEGLDLVTFHQMTSQFKIHREKIYTDDLVLLGDTVDLSLDGNIGFNGDLDMGMDIRYSGDVFRGAQATGGIANFMVQEAEQFISRHRVSGDLKHPKFEKELIPSGKVIGKKLTGLVESIIR